ncbi:MAG: radical SAM protein [Magnetococcales bacterium]|nr:radical SAM protein [Magnetococcales bacterium]
MRVLLITLPNEGEPRDYTTPEHFSVGRLRYIPLGVLAVASGIDPQHEVRILDSASMGLSIDETLAVIDEWDPDVVGMTATIGTSYAMKRLLSGIKRAKKVVGGPHATHFSDAIRQLGADAIFQHDADRSFNAWLSSGAPDGLFRDHVDDLDTLPMPRLELLDLDDYAISDPSKVLLKNSGLRFPMYSSKGCPFHCVFCDTQERGFRFKSPVRVVDEMVHALDHGAATVHLMDDCFNVKRSRVVAICDEIRKRNLSITWSARGRAHIDLETATALREAGCERLHVGVETLDPDLLHFVNKSITLDQMRRFFSICRQVGIQTLGYFIIGFPGETTAYRKALPEMIRELGVDIPFFNILYPLPHSEIYDRWVAEGIFPKDFWSQFARDPQPGFQPPAYAPPDLHQELLDTAEWYVDEFYQP